MHPMKGPPLIIVIVCLFVQHTAAQYPLARDDRFISYTVNPQLQRLELYWKDSRGTIFRNINNLKTWLEFKQTTLVFAMNGGMYKEDNAPLGLFIQQGKRLNGLNTRGGNGNFYLKPNGVFYTMNDRSAGICRTEDFNQKNVQFATQSGPMLVIDGQLHPAFVQGSTNLNIRNGVGVLPDNSVVFAISTKPVNFYDFANYFKQLGCKNALYLDGLVSRMYLPAQQWVQLDGNFGVIIGVTSQGN